MNRRLVAAFVVAATAFTAHRAPAQAVPSGCTAVHVIGDSLLANAGPALRSEFAAKGLPAPSLDAYVSRGIRRKLGADPRTGLEAVDWLRSAVGDADCWVIGLGTNDSAYSAASGYAGLIRLMVDRIGGADHRIWFVDVAGKTPRASFSTWNQKLREVVAGDDSLAIVPWSAAAAIHPEWFGGDGLHLNAAGTRGRAALIAAALARVAPDPDPEPDPDPDPPPPSCLPPPQPNGDGLYPALRERFPICSE